MPIISWMDQSAVYLCQSDLSCAQCSVAETVSARPFQSVLGSVVASELSLPSAVPHYEFLSLRCVVQVGVSRPLSHISRFLFCLFDCFSVFVCFSVFQSVSCFYVTQWTSAFTTCLSALARVVFR